jgi:asparagine synthase (glutamine-hydrolysing)
MCGIVGIAGNVDQSAERFAAQCRTLRHRGPDASGEWYAIDGNVVFGHRRLSIIDLSDAARQPMSDQQDQVQLILNGEIYNYREIRKALESLGRHFRSASDTEVLLQAYLQWDVDCLQRLNGMFAFAIYDLRKRKLFLARDRAGEKPLFYTHISGRFSFA